MSLSLRHYPGDCGGYRDHLRCLLDAQSNADSTYVHELLRR